MKQLEISNIRIELLDSVKGGLLGFASFRANNGLLLNSIAIRESRTGKLYLAYPAKISPAGREFFYFNPTNPKMAGTIDEAILSKLEQLTITKQSLGRACNERKEVLHNNV